jgi:hypothetical protein
VRILTIGFIAAAVQFSVVNHASAQSSLVRNWPPRPSLGVRLGVASCKLVGARGSGDAAVLAEHPIARYASARLEAGSTNCLLAAEREAGGYTFDRVMLARIELSAVGRAPVAPMWPGLYVGAGIGVYRYAPRSGAASNRFGVLYLVGLERLLRPHLIWNVEAKVGLRSGPQGAAVSNVSQVPISAGSALAFRF